jgi:phage gpG-like protein
MNKTLEIKFKFPKLEEKIKKNRTRIEQAIAASMQTNRSLLFDSSGEYNGHKKWDKPKLRSGKPLMKTGTLKKSIGPGNTGEKPKQGPNGIVQYTNGIVKIGTKLKYAAIQNYGGLVKAKKAGALKIPTEDGFIFRKKVKIPARNFTDITAADRQEFEDTIRNIISEVLKSG